MAIALGLAHAQPRDAVPMTAFAPVQRGHDPVGRELSLYAEGRVLVQFTDAALAASTLDRTRRLTGPAVTTTGLPAVDAIGARAGVRRITKAHIDARDKALERQLGIARWYLIEIAANADVEDIARQYGAAAEVEAATPDWRAFPAAVPNDPLHAMHWGHNNTAQMKNYCWGCGGHDSGTPVGTVGFDTDAQPAWDAAQGYGAASVRIAILDSGVEAGHPDLRQVAGYDYGSNDSNPDDDSADPGHGTACAGVAAAMANNGLGAAGAAGGCSIMPLKVADNAGSLFFSAIQNALIHAGDNGADVASMSFGAAISSDPATDSAIQYAYNAGVTLLAATGNENMSTISYPAIHANVIGVGAANPCDGRKRSSSSASEVNPGVATDPNGYTCDGERWWGSNYGSTTVDAAGAVDFLAPTILPTTDLLGSAGYDATDYSKWFNGTSCATPYAAGVAALVISANPTFTPTQVRQRLTSTCVDVVNIEAGTGWDRYSGHGLLNAASAVGSGGTPQQYATLPYSTGFEAASLDPYWTTATTGSGRVLVATANGPHGGTRHLTMDDATSGGLSQTEARLHLDLSSLSNVELTFWWKEFGDETHTQDGVYFSSNGGSSYVKVQSLNGQSYTDNTWQTFTLDVDALAAANGLTLTSTFVVKLQQYDDYPIATDGFAFDDISVLVPATRSVSVTAPNGGESFAGGSSTNVTWTTSGMIANVSIDYSTNGGSTWTSITSSTPNDGTHAWTVPSTATTQGRVRVSDATDGTVTDMSNGNFTITVPSGTYATLPYSTGFEAATLDPYWTTAVTGNGRVQVTTANGPHGGTRHLTMDDATSGGYSQTEARLRLDLTGQTQVGLTFWWKEFGDENHTQDGVYFSSNGGTSYVKVLSLNGQSYTNNTWQLMNLDLDALAAANGLSLTSTFVVKLQQYDDYPINTDGFAFDDVSVTATGGTSYITAESEPNGASTSADGPMGASIAVSGAISSSSDDDWFYFDVDVAGTVGISLDILGTADLDWFVYRSTDLVNWVARGYTTADPEVGSFSATVGRYYLFVDGYQGATSGYSLTLTGGAIARPFAPEKPDLPRVAALAQNSPNPFNPTTSIQMALPAAGPVDLVVYGLDGRVVRTLVSEALPAGFHTVAWDGRDDGGLPVASGAYIYRLRAGDFVSSRKMLLLK